MIFVKEFRPTFNIISDCEDLINVAINNNGCLGLRHVSSPVKKRIFQRLCFGQEQGTVPTRHVSSPLTKIDYSNGYALRALCGIAERSWRLILPCASCMTRSRFISWRSDSIQSPSGPGSNRDKAS